MKFDYIREFVTAARSAELQQAAAALSISPSSLTKHMSALESEIGASLFLHCRRTTLSRYGKIFLPYAEELASLQEKYKLDLLGVRSKLSGELTISVSPLFYRDRSRQVINSFSETFPDTVLNIVYHEDESIGQELLSGHCDLAFIRVNKFTKHEDGLIYYPFQSNKLFAVIMNDHPLAGVDNVDMNMLRYVRLYMYEKNLNTSDTIIKRCKDEGFEPDLVFTEAYMALDNVKNGEGILLYPVPDDMISTDSQLSYVPIEPVITCDIELAMRREPLSDLQWGFLRFAMENDKKNK